MQQDATPPQAPAVAEAIRRYLDAHPRAADTAQGIQRWWLAPEYGEVSLQTVEAALELLQNEGEVRKLEQAWSQAAYQRKAPH